MTDFGKERTKKKRKSFGLTKKKHRSKEFAKVLIAIVVIRVWENLLFQETPLSDSSTSVETADTTDGSGKRVVSNLHSGHLPPQNPQVLSPVSQKKLRSQTENCTN